MYNVYLPSLEKYIHHIHYVQIPSKNFCGKLRHNASYSKPGNISSIRDYAERTSTNFNLQIQSEHFGNRRSLSIEEYIIYVVDQDLNSNMEFHSHLSDDSRQDSSTTHAHILNMLTKLRNNNQLKERCTIWKSTDERYKQYRCGAILFFYLWFLLTLLLSLIVWLNLLDMEKMWLIELMLVIRDILWGNMYD